MKVGIDLDGVLCRDLSKEEELVCLQNPEYFSEFFQILPLIRKPIQRDDVTYYIITGRSFREKLPTIKWLRQHNVIYDKIEFSDIDRYSNVCTDKTSANHKQKAIQVFSIDLFIESSERQIKLINSQKNNIINVCSKLAREYLIYMEEK